MWEKVTRAFEIVDGINKIGDLVVLLASIIVPSFVITSSTLRWWMVAGVTLGAAVGFYVTTRVLGGKGKRVCLIFCLIHFIIGVMALGILVFLLAILKPEIASTADALVSMREFLLKSGFLPNLLSLVLCLAITWGFVAAITLLSSRLWNTQP